jgi:hypothetical protein
MVAGMTDSIIDDYSVEDDVPDLLPPLQRQHHHTRHAQGRWHQAEAARGAADLLRAWHDAGTRPGAHHLPVPPPVLGRDTPTLEPATTDSKQRTTPATAMRNHKEGPGQPGVRSTWR